MTISRDSGIIFDGDDTLWETEPLYDRARAAAGLIVAAATGSTVIEFENTQRALDLERVAVEGLSAERFPNSSVLAYQEIAGRYKEAYDEDIAQLVLAESRKVFSSVAPLVPDAREVLSLVSRHLPCALLTRGDVEVQMRRLTESGLLKYFSTSRVVNVKGSDEYLSLLAEMGCEPNSSWAVGNSIPSDIVPALEAKMNAVWIDSHVWEYERRCSLASSSQGQMIELQSLSQLPGLLREKGALRD